MQFVFVADSSKDRTIHEELAKNLKTLLRPNQMEPQIINKFMEHSSFFFEILTKSMAQHLLASGRIRVTITGPRFTTFLPLSVV